MKTGGRQAGGKEQLNDSHVRNCRAGQACRESPSSRAHMTQVLWVAFTHVEVALACASKALQDIRCVIKSLFLFDVVPGPLQQFSRMLNQCFLGFSDTPGKLGRVKLKNRGIVELGLLLVIKDFGRW